jgi:group I intron endonuclease
MSHIYSSSRRPKREYNQSWNHIPAAPGVYQISCTQNGKRYFGATQNLKQRWCVHRYQLKHGIHPTPPLQADYDQFGLDAFEIEVIQLCENMKPLDRKKIEHRMIQTENPEYNCLTIGEGHPRKQELSEKWSSRRRGRRTGSRKGVSKRKAGEFDRRKLPKSEEHKAKLREANLGQKRSPEAIENMRKAQARIRAKNLSTFR